MALATIFMTVLLPLVTLSDAYVQRRERTFGAAIEFWTEALCTVPSTKTVSFHGILTNASFTLHDFFEDISQGIGDHCDAVVLSKMYTIDNLEDEDTPSLTVKNNTNIKKQLRRRFKERVKNVTHTSLWSLVSMEHHFRTSQVIKKEGREKRRYINMWNINIIILEDREMFEKLLDRDALFEWTTREHFIILAIWDEDEFDDTGPIIERILRKFWTKHGIQNVFFNEPLSADRKDVIYSYNPFKKVNETVWGDIEIISWKSKRHMFYKLSTLTYYRTMNLNGRHLKIGIFNLYPTIGKMKVKPYPGSVYEYSGGYNGTDGILLGTVAKYMNFKVDPVEPEGYDKFGHEMENGTFTGILGDVVYRKVDVCVVPLFVKKYGNNMHLMEFTTHTSVDKLCVVVPKAFKIPKGFRIYHIFESSVWLLMMLSQILTYASWYWVKKYALTGSGEADHEKTIFETFMVSSGYPLRLPATSSERILLIGVFMSSMTIMGTFNGALYKCFAKDMYYKDIDTLTELDQSGLPISVASISVIDIFGVDGPDSTPLMASLRRKLIYGRNGIRHAAYYRNASGLLREFTYPLLRETYVGTDESHLLHLAKECPGQYYLSYLLPKNSIIRERMNVLLERLNQAGLPTLWKKRTLVRSAQRLRVNIEERHDHGQTESFAYKLEDMQTSFAILGLGYLLSTMVFFHEIGWLGGCSRKITRKGVCNVPR